MVVFVVFNFLLSGLYDSKNVRLLSGILPPEFYSIEEKQSECPLGLNCFKNYDEGKEYAIKNNKIILLTLQVGLVPTVDEWRKMYGQSQKYTTC